MIALRGQLRVVPDLLADLDIALSRQARLTSPYDRSRGRDRSPLPFDPGIAEVVWVLHNTLTYWVGQLAGASAPPSWKAGKAAQWLLSQLGPIRLHPDAATLADEITNAISRARNAIDRKADQRLFLGPCGGGEDRGCREEVYGLPWLRSARCPVCGAEHDIAERQEQLREQARVYWGTAVEIAGFLRATGMKVTTSMVWGYAHRGRLEGRRDRDGHTRFRMRDVLDAMEARYQRGARSGVA